MTFLGNEPRPFALLEQEFQLAYEEAIRECKELTPPYNPTIWITMIGKLGAAEAARRLVVSGDIQKGFQRLVDAERPELTIEWMILDKKWEPLFSEQHRAAARWRLRLAHVEPIR